MVTDMMIRFALAAALLAGSAPVLAQPAENAATAAPSAPADIKRGMLVLTSSGERIGKIDRVYPDSVSVIYHGKFISVPVSTLSVTDHGVSTTLTKRDISRL